MAPNADLDNTTPAAEDMTKDSSSAPAAAASADMTSKLNSLKMIIAFLALAVCGLLASTIYLAVDDNDSDSSEVERPKAGDNPCKGKRPDIPNVDCVIDAINQTGEQSGSNVTAGYQGDRETDAVPITTTYFEQGMCPVNVHWHLGAEHYSMGEFDENGVGPLDFHEGRQGFQCNYYDAADERFSNENYEWKHCIGMMVGQTYEVHWPHSAAGMCSTVWQYQTPFYDGVFCQDEIITATNTAERIGVQAQVFTIVNDEEFYFPDLFRGMLVDGKDKGSDLAKYTGSTTGTARNNEICSPFSPITWQVDRKCHLVSASTFDKMCQDMKSQADNMADDLYAHGSRTLVDDAHAANNHQRALLSPGLRKA